MTRLNLGCGLNTPSDWINIDASWNARLAQYPTIRRFLSRLGVLPDGAAGIPWPTNILIHDVRRRLPFPADSVSAIYCSHLLEHLYYQDAMKLLVDCMRILQPSGILRIVVPDLYTIVTSYMNEHETGAVPTSSAASPAHKLQERLLLRAPFPPSGSLPYKMYTALNDFHSHKWLYDTASLTVLFQEIGFADVREMKCHESRIAGIDEVEDSGRIENGAGICVEGSKPTRHLAPGNP